MEVYYANESPVLGGDDKKILRLGPRPESNFSFYSSYLPEDVFKTIQNKIHANKKVIFKKVE